MRVSFLSTLPEEEGERYQSELEHETGVTWNRVTFMDAVRNEGGVKPTHHARGSRENNELRRV